MSQNPHYMTPRTFAGRAYVYVAFVGGLWSAQWLLFWATRGLIPEPTLFGLIMLAIISLFWFFMPPRPWFPGKKTPGNSRDHEEP